MRTDHPDPVLLADLEARWPLPDHPGLRDELVAAWGAPGRDYHDLVHLHEVLCRLDELGAHVSFDARAVRLAAWFHDVVHRGASDDEAASAARARLDLAAVGLAPPTVEEVSRLVLLTEHHAPEVGDVAGAALCDADLGILAAPRERYEAYAADVRLEYAHVPDEAFALGRGEVLRTFLERPHLFSTAYAREHWEPRARENARRELAALTGPALGPPSGGAASDVADPPDAPG